MLFCGFTGMRCNLDKCWWMATFGVVDGDELTGAQWLPRSGWRAVMGPREAIERKQLGTCWRYLGMVQAGDGSDEQMVDALAREVAEAAEIMSRKRISLEGAVYLSNVVIMPRAMYRLKLSRATAKQIDAVQASMRRVWLRREVVHCRPIQ